VKIAIDSYYSEEVISENINIGMWCLVMIKLGFRMY
jgi:hypothetical protein